MKRKSLLALSLGIGAMLMATQHAFAQSRNCNERAVVLTFLSERFGETRRSIGLGPENQVVEVFASDETGSWTITVTRPDGVTCLVASGQSYEAVAEALPPAGNDA